MSDTDSGEDRDAFACAVFALVCKHGIGPDIFTFAVPQNERSEARKQADAAVLTAIGHSRQR